MKTPPIVQRFRIELSKWCSLDTDLDVIFHETIFSEVYICSLEMVSKIQERKGVL